MLQKILKHKAMFAAVIWLMIHKALPSPTSMSKKLWPPMKHHDIWAKSYQSKSIDNVDANFFNEKFKNISSSSSRHSKVLNFFSAPNEDECIADDGLRSGICMNLYECKMQGGKAKGDCALGFGVCCVFIVTCNEEIKNNITYFVSSNFPALLPKDTTSCSIKINPVSPDVSQIRLDFIHFSLGQPNRRNGICDGDVFRLFGGGGNQDELVLCGQNTGQHVYYNFNPLARSGVVDLVMNFTTNSFTSRLWEIRISQIPFSQRAPEGCLQYFTEPTGLLQTFNFAENGRHLANQNYKVCFKQLTGMCSIAYEPCYEQSFRIGPSNDILSGDNGSQFGGGGGIMDVASIGPGLNSPQSGAAVEDLQTAGSSNAADTVASPDTVNNDVVEGSGGGDIDSTSSSIFPSLDSIRDLFFSSRKKRYSNIRRTHRQLFSTCTDRITMPCIIEDFIGVGMGNFPTCVPVHCGLSLCRGMTPCRLESSVAPFRLGIRFGDGTGKGSPEDNIGACLKYAQLPCAR